MPTYTVRDCNEALGQAHSSGTYATVEEAIAAAKDRAKRSRKFVRFEIISPGGPVPMLTCLAWRLRLRRWTQTGSNEFPACNS